MTGTGSSEAVIETESDLAATFAFEDVRGDRVFLVSLATLLQCLVIAEKRHLVPPFDRDWAARAVPAVIRESVASVPAPAHGGGS